VSLAAEASDVDAPSVVGRRSPTRPPASRGASGV